MWIARALGVVIVGVGALLVAPGSHATQVAQAAPSQPTIPPDVINAITQASCNPAAVEGAVKQAVSANPALAADIAALGAGQCPGDAAGIAAAAATAAPTQAAAIVVAVILALPPGQQENDAPDVLLAVEQAVPDSTDQITTAITALALNTGPQGTGGRQNTGAPLVAPQTDVPSSPIR